jgi:PiT family inorganic phosphate transporter
MDGMVLLVLIVALGLAFDYTNGFHDAANVVSTVIATRALAPAAAILLAGVLNTLGATQISGVAQTISSGLVKPESTTQTMVLCALVGAIGWNVLTWYFGIPSSSSYALVGGLLGAALLDGGGEVVLWRGVVWKVIIPMILSPIAGFFLAFCLMKGLYYWLSGKARQRGEGVFRYLQLASASLVALSHGLNDAQKSMGIITLGLFASGMLAAPVIPFWVILSCAVMIGLGTASGGFRIIRTVGFQITQLKTIQGFTTELSASCVILTASFLGMPVSSTHMIVGSIAGVGASQGVKEVQWNTARKLAVAWVLTLPGSALFAVISYKVIAL